MNSSTVEVTYRGQVHRVPAGTTVHELVSQVDGGVPDSALSALVNRRQVMLDFPLRGRVEGGLVDYGDREGESVYKRSVSLLFYEAAVELYPAARVVIGQSLGNSYFYQIRGEVPHLAVVAAQLQARMEVLRDEQRPFVRQTVTVEEVEAVFRERGYDDKLTLLSTRRSSTVHTITCGSFVDLAHGPYAPHTGCLKTFAVIPYEDGLLLRFPRRARRDLLPPFIPRPLLFATFKETRSWQEVLGIHHVGQLNKLCLNGGIGDILRVAEGLHEKKIAHIADDILARRGAVRLVTVAGPSSSGKTTFVKRLGIQLKVNGMVPVALSLDNYYVDRERTPLNEDGTPDFEALEAIDLELFHEHLGQILAGREVMTPVFNFSRGQRKDPSSWVPLRLDERQVLVIEGIHGLNDRLTVSVPRESKYRIFISALSQLAIDDHNRIFTADARLIRRIVRDHLFRG